MADSGISSSISYTPVNFSDVFAKEERANTEASIFPLFGNLRKFQGA
jgi:hypothetical protein